MVYDHVVSKTLDCLGSGFDPGPKHRMCNCGFSSLVVVEIVGYFDGAEQQGKCGARMVIQMAGNHTFSLCMSARKGSNTRAELLTLWGLLFFAKAHRIELQQVLGDS